MNKIINGKRYDNETAKFLGETSQGRYGDFEYWEESLYRTKTGNYFLHGYGGAVSKYAVEVGGGNWSDGQKIIPISEETAKEWAETNLDGNEYESIFGEVDEDEGLVQISAMIPVEAKEKLDKLKKEDRKTVSEFIAKLIMDI